MWIRDKVSKELSVKRALVGIWAIINWPSCREPLTQWDIANAVDLIKK